MLQVVWCFNGRQPTSKIVLAQASIALLYKITSFPEAYPDNIAALDTFKVEIYKFSA
jgi:hypothetical protein